MKNLWSVITFIFLIIIFGIDRWKDGIILNQLIDSYHIVIFVLNVVGLLFLVYGFILWNKVKKLNEQTVSVENEDEHNVNKEKTFATMSLYFSISTTIFLFALATGFIVLRDDQPGIVLIAFVLLAASYIAKQMLAVLAVRIYPERKLNEIKSTEEFFDRMDDGERYVMFKAYYKAYNIVRPLLFTAIMASAIYSAVTGVSQIFSIIFMAIMLVLIDSIYIKTVKENA
ncbi:DUF3169 family protein [Bacillaceae bacterium W0354]